MTTPTPESSDTQRAQRVTNRRRFIAGAGLTVLGAGSLSAAPAAFGKGNLSTGDAAILRFLAAAEILETDLWQQYNELCGIQDHEVPHGTGNKAFTEALSVLDSDMAQYVHDNTEDEFTHFTFINAYLQSRGAQPVNLDQFRTLPGSTAKGAANLKRITNLMELTVDTSWWTRYRSRTKNPDNGDTSRRRCRPWPRAAGRPSLAPTPTSRTRSTSRRSPTRPDSTSPRSSRAAPACTPRSLSESRTWMSCGSCSAIGPTEAMHFQTWSDKAGNAPALRDPTNGLVFPDLNKKPFGGEDFQTNLIMPEPTTSWLGRRFPAVSIVRPTETKGIAMGVAKFLTDMGLFRGQSPAFFTAMTTLAKQADAAKR